MCCDSSLSACSHWMGWHRSQVADRCDRQPGLVGGEHAAGRVGLPFQWLAPTHHGCHSPPGFCHFDLVVSYFPVFLDLTKMGFQCIWTVGTCSHKIVPSFHLMNIHRVWMFPLLSCRWIPESARWLLAKGKVEKAQFYLDKCSQVNKKQKLSSQLKYEVNAWESLFSTDGPQTHTHSSLLTHSKSDNYRTVYILQEYYYFRQTADWECAESAVPTVIVLFL